MNIHGIRTHPPGLYIVLSVPDVLPLSHVLLYNIYKFAVPTSIPLRFILLESFVQSVFASAPIRKQACIVAFAHPAVLIDN